MWEGSILFSSRKMAAHLLVSLYFSRYMRSSYKYCSAKNEYEGERKKDEEVVEKKPTAIEIAAKNEYVVMHTVY